MEIFDWEYCNKTVAVFLFELMYLCFLVWVAKSYQDLLRDPIGVSPLGFANKLAKLRLHSALLRGAQDDRLGLRAVRSWINFSVNNAMFVLHKHSICHPEHGASRVEVFGSGADENQAAQRRRDL